MIGVEAIGDDVSFVPVVDFLYPDEGDEPAPVVRDQWRPAPLATKCQQRFAVVPSHDVMTMPLLDKRIEVLSYALREAVERMDFNLIHQLAEKAIATRERIATEQLAASTPGLRERHGDIVIHDDAERGKVVVQFPERVDERTRRVLKIYGFCGSGDGATYWRRRTFRRGENMALDRARDLVERLLDDRAKLAASEQAALERENPSDQALISDWESGKAFPRKPRLQQLVAALKQPPTTGPGTHNWFKARSHEFGQKLRAWRKARGLRQLDTCAVLGLPRDQGLICRYERGEASPRRERMTRILAIIAGTEVQP